MPYWNQVQERIMFGGAAQIQAGFIAKRKVALNSKKMIRNNYFLHIIKTCTLVGLLLKLPSLYLQWKMNSGNYWKI